MALFSLFVSQKQLHQEIEKYFSIERHPATKSNQGMIYLFSDAVGNRTMPLINMLGFFKMCDRSFVGNKGELGPTINMNLSQFGYEWPLKCLLQTL